MDFAHGRNDLSFLIYRDTCPICFDPFCLSGESMVLLPCKHIIGHRCLFKWLDSSITGSATCILCRRNPFLALNRCSSSSPYDLGTEPLIHSWTTSPQRALAPSLPLNKQSGTYNAETVWEWSIEDLTTRCPRKAMWALVYKYLCSFPPDVNIRRFIHPHSDNSANCNNALHSTFTTLLARLTQDEKVAKKQKLCIGHILTLKRMLRHEIWRRQQFDLDPRVRKLRNMRDAIRLAVMQTPHLMLSFRERLALVCPKVEDDDVDIFNGDAIEDAETHARWKGALEAVGMLREYWVYCCANSGVETDGRVFARMLWETYSCPRTIRHDGAEEVEEKTVVYVQYKRRIYAYCPLSSSLARECEGDVSMPNTVAGKIDEEPAAYGFSLDAADLSTTIPPSLTKRPNPEELRLTKYIEQPSPPKARPRSNAIVSPAKMFEDHPYDHTDQRSARNSLGRSMAGLAKAFLSTVRILGMGFISKLQCLTILLIWTRRPV